MTYGKTKKQLQSKQRKRRGNSRYIATYLSIAILIPIMISIAYIIASRVEYFTITRIEIVGNQNLNSSFLEEMSSGFIGMNLFSVSEKNISLKYENIVRVKNTKIKRILPDKLRIIVNERTGHFYIKTVEGYLIPIDKGMVVLDNNGFYLSEDLPIIDTDLSVNALTTGTVLENDFIVEVYQIHSIIEESLIDSKFISEYYRLNSDLYIIEARTGSRICIGSKNYEERLTKLEFVWRNIGIETHQEIDLRFDNQVVLRGNQ